MRLLRIAPVLAVGLLWKASLPGQEPGKTGQEPPDYLTQVQPKLVKAGCFSGACHGSGSGKGGFKLSLLGYDPELDYEAIVNQYRGRRLNRVLPEESLLLLKATGQVEHEGEARFSLSSDTYRTTLEWIRGGTPYTSESARQIVELKVLPALTTVHQPGQGGSLKVIATFSDGSSEDVTPYSLYTSSDDSIVSITQTGSFRVNRPGETGMTARYLGLFSTARAGMPFAGDTGRLAGLLGDADSFIDSAVNGNLLRLRIEPSALCSDSEFLRRASLDVTGTLPTPEEARAFLEDQRPDKRRRLVDRLLARPEYGSYWSLWLLDLLRVNSRKVGEANFTLFAQWLRAELNLDRSVAELTRRLLTARGDGRQIPAVNYLSQNNDPKLLSELTTEAFMGSSSRCAQCHNHPFDSWTQTQYHQMVAFFVRIRKTDHGTELVDHGEIEHPKTGKPVEPGFPDGASVQASGDRRQGLAEWLVSPENPYFSRSLSNRVWARLLGRGVVEPVDGLSVSNPPSNPQLLESLERFFAGRLPGRPAAGHSLKALIREIILSDTYQRSAEANAVNRQDDRFYSRALARPLDAHALSDAISQVTGVPETFSSLPEGTRAIEVADASQESYLLDVCGRCRREESCDQDDTGSGGVRQALHLINGPVINAKIAAPEGRLDRLRRAGAGPEAVMEEFFYAALSRPPSPQEREFWLSQVGSSQAPEETTEDLIWALLNSRAFVFNR